MVALLRYQETQCFREHDIGIAAVAFSSQATYLGTAGLDGRVCIWDVNGSKLWYVYKSDTPILSIAWVANSEDSVIVGFQDGNVGTLHWTSSTLSLHGFAAHEGPIESLAVHGSIVATGGQQEVRVWEWHPNTRWSLLIALPGPPKVARNLSLEVLVVNIHWTVWDEYPLVLTVSYLNHGVFMYEATLWTLVHIVPNISGPIARTSISLDGSTVAVHDLAKGIEIRATSDGTLQGIFPHDPGERYLVPVVFVHGDGAVVAGTTTGVVNVWDRTWSHKIQGLHHEEKDRVLALAGYYNRSIDRFMIATGTYGSQSQPSVRLWVAEEERQSTRTAQDQVASHLLMSKKSPFTWLTTLLFCAVVILALLAFAPEGS